MSSMSGKAGSENCLLSVAPMPSNSFTFVFLLVLSSCSTDTNEPENEKKAHNTKENGAKKVNATATTKRKGTTANPS